MYNNLSLRKKKHYKQEQITININKKKEIKIY